MRELLKFVPTLAIALFVVTTLGGQAALAGNDNYAEYKRGLTAYQQGNYDEALAIWQPLADRGYPAAQFNIGMLYQNGVGVDRDLTTANAYFADAVDRDFAPAQLELGEAYLEGDGVDQNIDRAVSLMVKAADQGYAQAQYEVGLLYREGDVISRDHVRALEYFLLAAEQGDAEAQYHAGFMYGSGYGAPQDFALAYMYYDLASQTLAISNKARDHLAEYMTPEELSQAQALLTAHRTTGSTGQDLASSTQ